MQALAHDDSNLETKATNSSLMMTTPRYGVVKLNVDDNSFGNPDNSGFGEILRDNLGQWIYEI